ncbi:hypothetical protein CEV31_3446 [Brucella thiophenivorans]|uniref:Uncharacterized protein n=1 Tax=Brucella thiophenivorans TaxID=571255 RepID=A0A256FF29_9HYPH|nr:hypothetical protein CEV31_3446 [Brucella thiophenivorans]
MKSTWLFYGDVNEPWAIHNRSNKNAAQNGGAFNFRALETYPSAILIR